MESTALKSQDPKLTAKYKKVPVRMAGWEWGGMGGKCRNIEGGRLTLMVELVLEHCMSKTQL